MKKIIILSCILLIITIVLFSQNKVKSDSTKSKNKPLASQHKFEWNKNKKSDSVPIYDPAPTQPVKDATPILELQKGK